MGKRPRGPEAGDGAGEARCPAAPDAAGVRARRVIEALAVWPSRGPIGVGLRSRLRRVDVALGLSLGRPRVDPWSLPGGEHGADPRSIRRRPAVDGTDRGRLEAAHPPALTRSCAPPHIAPPHLASHASRLTSPHFSAPHLDLPPPVPCLICSSLVSPQPLLDQLASTHATLPLISR